MQKSVLICLIFFFFQRIINNLLAILFTFYFPICYSKGEPESTQLTIPEVTSDVEPLPESFLTEPLNLATGIDFSLDIQISSFFLCLK